MPFQLRNLFRPGKHQLFKANWQVLLCKKKLQHHLKLFTFTGMNLVSAVCIQVLVLYLHVVLRFGVYIQFFFKAIPLPRSLLSAFFNFFFSLQIMKVNRNSSVNQNTLDKILFPRQKMKYIQWHHLQEKMYLIFFVTSV